MTTEEKTANAIADRLFMNGFGEKADRLVLTRDNPHADLGGLCRRAVVDQIVAVLREANR